MGEHAILAPSSAGEFVYCPASVKHQWGRPVKEPHPTTVEGNVIHGVSAKVLEDFIYRARKGHTFNRADFLDSISPEGVVITDEMLDIAEVYIRDVMEVSSRFNGLSTVMVEYRVRMPQVHEHNWGTLDAAIHFHCATSRLLVVEDLKCGWGIVEVYENWQLIDYAIGLINDMMERGIPLPERIEFRLVQPRPYHRDGPIRVWTITLQELEPYILKLREAALDAMSDNPTFRTGGHCAHCEGREDCPALINSGYKIIEVLKGVSPATLSPAAIGKHITMLREASALIKALGSALEDKALSETQNGRPIPGWEWGRTRSSTKWSGSKEEIAELAGMFGVDVRKKDLITPKQAIDAGVDADLVKALSVDIPGSMTLVPVDTKRVAKIFQQQE